jgi:predicted nuclease of predicted toxin-antitoxin system
MKVRFLADVNLDERIVDGVLRWEPAVDFVTAPAAKLRSLDDVRVLGIAANEERILVTHDRKTMPYAFSEFIANHSSPGVIIVPKDLPLRTAIDELILIWAASTSEEWTGMLVQLNR